MTVLMQTLVKRLAQLRWTDVFGPQVPSAVCATLVGIAVGATRIALHVWGMPGAWLELGVTTGVGTVFYIAFILFAPFDELRLVVRETLQDFAPSLAKRIAPDVAPSQIPA